MAFHFSLESVLRLRKSIEQREYLALEKLQAEVARGEAELREAEEWIKAASRKTENELAGGIPAIHLQRDIEQEASLERQRNAIQAKLRELNKQKVQKLAAYQKARQNRQVLDDLRTRQLNEYTREQAKREQSRLDDLFLARRQREK
jgi:flagellar export protein FliJ